MIGECRTTPIALSPPVSHQARLCVDPMVARGGRHRFAIAIALMTIAAVFAGRAWSTALSTSLTFDEDTHLARGIYAWSTGDDPRFWKLGTPALPHMLNAFPAYLALESAGLMPDSCDFAEIEKLVRSGAPEALVPARLVVIGWGVGLILMTYYGVARTWGSARGLWAAALLSLVPEVIAHSAIAGSDIPFVTAAVLCVTLLARFAERPTAARWLAVALGIGLAWSLRHSAVILIMLAPIVHLSTCGRRVWYEGWTARARALAHAGFAASLLTAIAFLVLWAGDGFGRAGLADLLRQRVDRSMTRSESSTERGSPAIVPTSLASLVTQVSHQNRGHSAFLCGDRRGTGWQSYFPIALTLKTPLGLLALLILAAARIRPTGQFLRISIALVVLTWVLLIRSKVDIGLRYALITYPLVVPMVARLFDRKSLADRVWSPVAWVALAAFAWSSVSSHPRYLSYFNEIGGGPSRGYLYLSDSNVDWGQDYDAMLAALKRRGIREVTTAVFSCRSPSDPDVRIFEISADSSPGAQPTGRRRIPQASGRAIEIPTRYVAVSATRLHRLYSTEDLGCLFTRRLVERIGDGVFLFDLDTPADCDPDW